MRPPTRARILLAGTLLLTLGYAMGKIEIVAGVKISRSPGATVRVRGGGLPRFQQGGRGHVWARIQYDVPKKPSRKLKRALEALRDVEGTEPGPARRAFEDLVREHRQNGDQRGRS